MYPGLGREGAEWFFWFELALLFPLFATAGKRVFPWIALAHLIFSVFSSSSDFLAKVSAGTGLEWSALPLSVPLALVTIWIFFRLARGPGRKLPSVAEPFSALALAGFLFCITRNGEHLVGFPLFYFRRVIDIFLFLGFFWFSWNTFFGKNSGATKQKRFWNSPYFWPLLYLAWGLQPVAQLNSSSLHHYSFLAGPVELLRLGGRLLYEVPSQYGFLSIVLPAALPFSALKSVQVVLGLMMAAQAWLVFRSLTALPLKNHREVWCGVTAFVIVFLLPGDHSDLGAITYPNTSAFRFFPALLFTWLLSRREKVRLPLLATSSAIGCFWSLESAVFCSGAWGYAAAAETWVLIREKTQGAELKKAIARLGAPLVGAVFLGGLVQAFYRFYWGISPDWVALSEYSKVYSATHYLSPIDPRGALNLLLIFLAVIGTGLMVPFQERPSRALAANFGFWGLATATFPYFVARSEPINAVTLIAFWLALFFTLLPGWLPLVSSSWKNFLLTAAFLFSVVFVPFSLPNPIKYNLGNYFRQWGMLLGVAPLKKIYPLESLLHELPENSTPLVNLTMLVFAIPSVSNGSFQYVPWNLVHPAEQFCLLPAPRRETYLRRFLAWHTPKIVRWLREEKSEPCADQVREVIGSRYKTVGDRKLPSGLVLETLELR